SSGSGFRWERKDRHVDIPPGSYTITAFAGENDESRSASMQLEVPAGRPIAVTFDLRTRTGIIIRPRPAPGMDASNLWRARACALRVDRDGAPDDARLLGES